MKVTISNQVADYGLEEVPYVEMEVAGNKHTLTVRKYPKNTTIQMWKNSDHRGTKIQMKVPNDLFTFPLHISQVLTNFDTTISDKDLHALYIRWNEYNAENNF